MLLNIFPPKKSLKNLIINTLINSNGLTVTEVKKSIKNRYEVSATYQGINKILHFLKEEKIVNFKDKLWFINK